MSGLYLTLSSVNPTIYSNSISISKPGIQQSVTTREFTFVKSQFNIKFYLHSSDSSDWLLHNIKEQNHFSTKRILPHISKIDETHF